MELSIKPDDNDNDDDDDDDNDTNYDDDDDDTRTAEKLPKQGNKYPWKLLMNYFVDYVTFLWYGVDEESLEFQSWDKKNI